MIGQDFANMIQSGLRPVITFTKEVDELEAYPEAGMRARVISAVQKHDDIIVLRVDYTDFDEFNEQFETANYYDGDGNATKTARESGHYTPQEDLYIGLDAEIPFSIVESNRLKLYDQYRQHNKDFPGTSYVQWLEDQIAEIDVAGGDDAESIAGPGWVGLDEACS